MKTTFLVYDLDLNVSLCCRTSLGLSSLDILMSNKSINQQAKKVLLYTVHWVQEEKQQTNTVVFSLIGDF